MSSSLEDCEIQLTLEHLPFLVEKLSSFASKWRDIGTVLEFQQNDIDNIQACLPLMNNSPYSFLQRLVKEWLERKHPYTTPPTLANLLKALNSHTVRLGTLATRISNSLPRYEESVDTNVFKIATVSDKNIIMFSRSEDIRVSEDTRNIRLEVKTSSETQKCLWKSEGMTLESYAKDLDKPTLCIAKVNVDIDGSQCSCVVYVGGHYFEVAAISVTLRVCCPQLDQFKESLASIYLARPEVPEDSWPPVSNKTYINLVLIKREKINYGGEYARLTIRGDMDDILHNKEKIGYDNVFNGLKSGSLLLIEGRPGSGKTTFVHKITRDWAASEVQGPRRLVLLVSLRVLNSWNKPIILQDILDLLNLRIKEESLNERNGRGVCFIFDGLDEFSPLEGENSIVYKIINKAYLPHSMVIVASRPAALARLRQRADKVVEVIGFTKDQIFEYVQNYPFSDISKVDQLKSYLSSHPNVLHMCYLPIHAAMVTFLFKVMGKVPRTETEIYTHFTRFTLMRSFSKHKEQDESEDVDASELRGEKKEIFSTICKFALEQTVLNKQVLDNNEMKLHLQSKGCKDISLGLVTVDCTAGLYGFKNIYTFLHLTYQEYLAACHISTLSDEDQHQLIKEYRATNHMQVVWKFYCGLVDFKGHEYKIKALISHKNIIDLTDIQYAYESQQKIICEIFVEKMNAQIILEDKYLTTTDFTALGYLLANSPKPVSLSFISCDVNAEAASTMLAETEKNPFSLHTLHCKLNKMDLTALIVLLSNSSEPVSVSLIRCNLIITTVLAETGEKPLSLHTLYCKSSSMDLAALVLLSRNNSKLVSLSLIQCNVNTESNVSRSLPHLKQLTIKDIKVGPRPLPSILLFCEGMTSLALCNTVKSLDFEALLAQLSKYEKLEKISCSTDGTGIHGLLSECHIDIASTDTGSTDVTFPGIERWTSMLYVYGRSRNGLFQVLRLTVFSDTISSSHLKATSKYWSRIDELKLLHNFSYGYLKILPSVLEYISDFGALKRLKLAGIKIGCIRGTVLASKLSHCALLQELDLSDSLLETGLTAVLTNLKNCSNLQKLILNSIPFKQDDSCVLASCLQHWPKLEELQLKDCGVRDEGARAIDDNIRKYCPKLTKASTNSQASEFNPSCIECCLIL